ncbi:hypothetical protein D3C80_1694620 [compost metagenome]
MEVGVRHPGRIEVDRFNVQSFFDEIGVVQQAVVGGVGDHRVRWPAGVRRFFHPLGDGGTAEFALRDAAENTVGITGWPEVDRRDVTHHHQMGQ